MNEVCSFFPLTGSLWPQHLGGGVVEQFSSTFTNNVFTLSKKTVWQSGESYNCLLTAAVSPSVHYHNHKAGVVDNSSQSSVMHAKQTTLGNRNTWEEMVWLVKQRTAGWSRPSESKTIRPQCWQMISECVLFKLSNACLNKACQQRVGCMSTRHVLAKPVLCWRWLASSLLILPQLTHLVMVRTQHLQWIDAAFCPQILLFIFTTLWRQDASTMLTDWVSIWGRYYTHDICIVFLINFFLFFFTTYLINFLKYLFIIFFNLYTHIFTLITSLLWLYYMYCTFSYF